MGLGHSTGDLKELTSLSSRRYKKTDPYSLNYPDQDIK